jgi:anaerobic ribonucleoside-triphosphate reductase
LSLPSLKAIQFRTLEVTIVSSQSILTRVQQDQIISSLLVRKRDNLTEKFNDKKLERAITSAFESIGQEPNGDLPDLIAWIRQLTVHVAKVPEGHGGDRAAEITVDALQEIVELSLMRSGRSEAARAYIEHRVKHDHRRKGRLSRILQL